MITGWVAGCGTLGWGCNRGQKVCSDKEVRCTQNWYRNTRREHKFLALSLQILTTTTGLYIGFVWRGRTTHEKSTLSFVPIQRKEPFPPHAKGQPTNPLHKKSTGPNFSNWIQHGSHQRFRFSSTIKNLPHHNFPASFG